MNRKDYAAHIALRNTARMDRGFRHAPAVAMPRKPKPAHNSSLVPVCAAAVCAVAMFAPYFIGA